MKNPETEKVNDSIDNKEKATAEDNLAESIERKSQHKLQREHINEPKEKLLEEQIKKIADAGYAEKIVVAASVLKKRKYVRKGTVDKSKASLSPKPKRTQATAVKKSIDKNKQPPKKDKKVAAKNTAKKSNKTANPAKPVVMPVAWKNEVEGLENCRTSSRNKASNEKALKGLLCIGKIQNQLFTR
jgi:hypothetical protein